MRKSLLGKAINRLRSQREETSLMMIWDMGKGVIWLREKGYCERKGLEYLELFEAFIDLIHSVIDLLTRVSSHEGDTDECVFGGDGRSDNGSYEDASFEEHVSEKEGLVVIADEERNDGCFGVANFKSELSERVERIMSDVPQGLATFRFGTHNVESSKDRGGGSWGNGGCEDIGTDTVLHVVDGFLVGGDETADRSEGFREGTHDEFDLWKFRKMVACSASFVAKDAKTVSFIDHEGGLILIAEVHKMGDGGNVAFHREYAVGYDEFRGFERALLKDALEVFNVVVFVFVGSSESDLFAFHNRGVITLVVDDKIVAASDARDNARVSLETSREKHDAVFAHEFGEFVL